MEQAKDKQYQNHICRAKITASANEDYDFECVAVPMNNGQMRYDYENDIVFNQILRTGKDNIDTSRLDIGLPLFDNHPWDQSASKTLGVTLGYEFTEEGIVVRCKLGARADEALRADIKNGIINTVSIEGTVQRYSMSQTQSGVPDYYAEMWTPESLSFAPVPNDTSAQIKRALSKQLGNEAVSNDSFFNQLINKF